MRVLTVPNWSFGRDTDLLRKFEKVLDHRDLSVHYLQPDVDHNRTVSAFSGEFDLVEQKLFELAELAFDRIDLNRHTGVHPRTGALDVCPFVTLPEWDVPFDELDLRVQDFAEQLATKHEIPVFLYEKSELGRHEADLPSLRKGGFGGLLERQLSPDFGPSVCHPRLGVTITGVRDFLIAVNMNLATEKEAVAKELARRARTLRQEGDPRFLGIRALGFLLASRHQVQVSFNLTLPDITTVDPIFKWCAQESLNADVAVADTELVGVIRQKDLAGATRLPVKPNQIVDRVKNGVSDG